MPGFEYARARSSPFGPVRPENLDLRPVLSMHVPILARLGPVRLENLSVRPWSRVYIPFGAHLGLYAKQIRLYAPEHVRRSTFVPVWDCTPRKPGFTPRFEYARARSSPFGSERIEYPAVGPCASVYVPFGAHLRQYSQDTWLYVTGRVCTSPFVLFRPSSPQQPGFTPSFEYARTRSSPFGPVRLENLSVGH